MAKTMRTFGSRRQVMNRTAKMTTGRLTRNKLRLNKRGRIVSIRRSKTAKRNNRLVKAGWVTKKGKFGSFRKKIF